jgi:hypothetical protein
LGWHSFLGYTPGYSFGPDTPHSPDG